MMPADLIADDPLAVLRARTLQAVEGHPAYQDLRRFDWTGWMGRIDGDQASLADLAEALLADALPEAGWLLILDQMEELFTTCDPAQRERFITQLTEALRPAPANGPPRLRVLATLRADFAHHAIAHPDLRYRLEGDGSFLLGAPQRLALERMIKVPLTKVEPAQSGSGVAADLPWTIDPAVTSQAWCAAAPGPAIGTSRARTAAAAPARVTGTTSTASGCCARPPSAER